MGALFLCRGVVLGSAAVNDHFRQLGRQGSVVSGTEAGKGRGEVD